MSRGGARPNSGPAPDPQSFRTMQRRQRGEALPPGWVVLPVTGRSGPPPAWPLPEPSEREMWHWERLWKTPQATEWERLGVEADVGLYVRRLVEVEQPGASAAACNLLMRMEEALGLSLPGLQARRWQLGRQQPELATVKALRDDDEEELRDRFGPPRSSRDRMSRGRIELRDRWATPESFRRPGDKQGAEGAGGED